MQDNNVKTVVNIPGWAEYFTGENNSESSIYQTVPLVNRSINLVSNAASTVPLKLYKGKGESRKQVDWLWPETEPQEWTRKSVISILMYGAAYSVKLSNGYKSKGLQWINPTSITVEPIGTDENGAPIIKFRQTPKTIGGKARTWGNDEMLYIKEFNPIDDVRPGPSALKVALTDAGLIRYLTRFASFYFQNGAMPLTILSVDKSTDLKEVERVQNLFKQLTTGIRNAWRFMVLRGGKDSAPFTITPPLKDLVMPELHEQARRAIAGAFGIPQTMLEDAANYATATEHTMQFWTTCIRPRCMQLSSALNEQVFGPMGYECEYAFEELDVFQADEAERAGSLGQLTAAGIPLLMAMDILGYDLDDDERAELEAMIEDKKEKADTIQENISNANENKPAEEPEEQQPDLAAGDMQKWQKKSIKAFEKTGAANVPFETSLISADVQDTIHAKLSDCKTVEDIRAVFASAKGHNKTGQSIPVEWIAELKRANDLLESVK